MVVGLSYAKAVPYYIKWKMKSEKITYIIESVIYKKMDMSIAENEIAGRKGRF
jgi:hypothetical protein